MAALDPDPTTSTTGARAPVAGGGTARLRPGSPQAELAVLRAPVAALESQNALLASERDILRRVAPSPFYAWLAAAPGRAARASADTALAQRIRKIHDTDTATPRAGGVVRRHPRTRHPPRRARLA